MIGALSTFVLVLSALVLVGCYLVWMAGRLDRMHNRVEAARASLDAQLMRRAAAARELAGFLLAAGQGNPQIEAVHRAARHALTQPDPGREAAENTLSRALAEAVRVFDDGRGRPAGTPLALPGAQDRLIELDRATTRVGLARQFHNDAVRDSRVLRSRRLPRALRLYGHAPLFDYFEIDDTALGVAPALLLPAPGRS